MITIFTIPKPFVGHIGVIQRNAIHSWRRLHPETQVILFGRETGTAEVAAELGCLHLPDTAQSELGTPLLQEAFAKVRQHATNKFIAFVNADIILLPDAVEVLAKIHYDDFLLVGLRFNIDLDEALDLSNPQWPDALKRKIDYTQSSGLSGSDYFIFPHGGKCGNPPPFVVGRQFWDNWMFLQATREGLPLIDASLKLTAIHQNHDYGHIPQRNGLQWDGPESTYNKHVYYRDVLERSPSAQKRYAKEFAILCALKPEQLPKVRVLQRNLPIPFPALYDATHRILPDGQLEPMPAPLASYCRKSLFLNRSNLQHPEQHWRGKLRRSIQLRIYNPKRALKQITRQRIPPSLLRESRLSQIPGAQIHPHLPMRILHVVVSRNFAGSERLAQTLALEQQAAGHSVWLALRKGGDFIKIALESGLNTPPVIIHKRWTQRPLSKAIRQNGIELVHFHLTDATKHAEPLARKFPHLGIVTHLHINKDSPCYQEAAQQGLLVAVSNATRDFYLSLNGINPSRVRTILNGSLAHRSTWAGKPRSEAKAGICAELGLSSSATLILHPGRMTPSKGQDLSIAALAQLQLPERPHLLIAGKSNAYTDELRKQAARLHLSDYVHFLGFRSDVERLMRAADVVLVPSRSEPFGLVVIEAMLLETPVVTSGVDGIQDILCEPEMALTFATNDSESLAKAIKQSLLDVESSRQRAAHAHAIAMRLFTSSAMAEKIQQVYLEACLLKQM